MLTLYRQDKVYCLSTVEMRNKLRELENDSDSLRTRIQDCDAKLKRYKYMFDKYLKVCDVRNLLYYNLLNFLYFIHPASG